LASILRFASAVKKIFSNILWIVVVLLAIKLIAIAISYFSFKTDHEFLLVKQDMLHNFTWVLAFYIHLLAGAISVLTGLSLFFSKWIRPSSTLHKIIGKIYFISIMFFAGPTGLYLGFYSEAGYLASIGFIGMSLAWMIPTFMSVYTVSKGNVAGHYKWTIRSYAMTLAGVTLRIMTPIGIHYFNWSYDFTFIITAYIPWMFNLGLAEIIIYTKQHKMPEIIKLGNK
jgi:hypothetical protein